jgi:CRISPR-associated protein (TIGR02584 family)
METQTVLISLVGTTPAVLTETVWALATAEDPVVPDEIVAITTVPGADLLKRLLFADGHWGRMLEALRERGVEDVDAIRFGDTRDSIRVFPSRCGRRELDDVRTPEDFEAVAEFFTKLLRGYTANDSCNLIVSIAGGRKTTSALLHSVMTLLGRAQDRINHVLVDDAWIRQPNFLYPGCAGTFIDPDTKQTLSSQDASLHLADVPFVPLRNLFQSEMTSTGSFVELVHRLRVRSSNLGEDLRIRLEPARGTLAVNGRAVPLSGREFLLYLAFARRAKQGQPPLKAFADIEPDMRQAAEDYREPLDFGHWSHEAMNGFDAAEDPRRLANFIRRKLADAGFADPEIARLVPGRGRLHVELPPDAIEIA